MTNPNQPRVRSTPIQMSVLAPNPLRGLRTPNRSPAVGSRFAVATDHPTTSLIGMDALQAGGNAIDAAIAVSAACVVTMPYRTHLGGDAFCLIWDRRTDEVECLNAGGRAPTNATLDAFPDGIPGRGATASTVPGLVDAWAELDSRHGSQPLSKTLAPAIELAESGFAVSAHMASATSILEVMPSDETNEAIRAVYLADGGRPSEPGETLRQPALAETLQHIAQDGRDGFYGGPVGRAIADAMAVSGGLITADDLAQPAAHWEDPLSITFDGCTVYEQALPSQGLVLLETLNIVEEFPLGDWGIASPDAVHVMVEALKLAFDDVRRHAADPTVADVPVERLLSKEHARILASQIDVSHAAEPTPAITPADTTSFVVADEHTVVAFIQSIYWPWGSGFVVPNTGVLMNNRMLCFDTDPRHPNCLAPGKRTVHTLNNFLVTHDGQLVIGGGTPGGDNQVQINLQVLVGVRKWGLTIQSAIDAPHFVMRADGGLGLESRVSDETLQALEARGHRVQRIASWDGTVSRSQLIASREAGGWLAATDMRGEGVALAR